jgi:hypothetical protein
VELGGVSPDELARLESLECDGFLVTWPLVESDAAVAIRRVMRGEGWELSSLADIEARVRKELDPAENEKRKQLARQNAGRWWPLDLETLGGLEAVLDVCDQLWQLFWGHVAGPSDRVPLTCVNILQTAITTGSAIHLLLEHGYVADAEARWRGLHELACTASLIAQDADHVGICTRYLAHGNQLGPGDPALGEAWRTDKFLEWDYEWLRVSHPYVSRKGKPIRFGQSWLFQNSGLKSAPYLEWLKPSHGSVHISSTAVGLGSRQAGPAPAGFDPSRRRLVAWQTACSSYEVAAQLLCLMVAGEMEGEASTAAAWISELEVRVGELRPGPIPPEGDG